MALLWIDGFDNYGTTTAYRPQPDGILARRYPFVAYEDIRWTVETGRFSDYALKSFADEAGYISPGYLTTNATLVVGVAVKFTAQTSAQFLRFYDGTTPGMNVRQASGELAVYRGTTLMATTVGLNLQINTWYYIEFKVVCNSTTGAYTLKVSGTTVLNATSVNTKAGTHDYHNTFYLFGHAAAPVFDDLYCLDGSGSINNDILGNMRVTTLRPNGAGDSTQFTPSAGSNYQCVDEAVLNDGTDYVEDGTSGHKDLYTYTDTALSGIKGVAICTDCRETDAQNFSFYATVKTGGSEYDGTAIVVGSNSFLLRQRLMETDPSTNAVWAATDLNAAQFGVKVV